MMKKKYQKLLALLLVMLFILQGVSAAAETDAALEEEAAEASAEASPQSDRDKEIAAVMEYLLGDGFFAEATVTRAEFTGALMRAFSIQVDGYSSVFSDVTEETPYAAEISAAYAAGIVSPAEQFEPLAPLQYEQAVKMVIHALGYEALAEYYGGYPQGYIRAARNIDLLNQVPREEGGMSVDSARSILYNLLTSTIRYTGMMEGYARYEQTDVDYLESLYQLRRTEGVITATQYNSYRPGIPLQAEPGIEIDGVHYPGTDCNPGLLGSNACVYYNKDTNRAEIVVPVRNQEIQTDLENVSSLDRNKLEFYDPNTGRGRSYQTGGSIVIYNGRAVETLDFADVLDQSGSIRLLDNDRDGQYEYLFITCYRYLYVNQVDIWSKTITDMNAAENSIQVDPSKTALVLEGVNGEALEFEDVKSGNLFLVERSLDDVLITARLCTEQISGTITQVTGEGEIYIDDQKYLISAYAQEHYAAQMMPGGEGTFLLGYNGEVVVASGSSSDMEYGYLIHAAIEDVFGEEIQLKIYTQGEEIKIFHTDRARLDNQSERAGGKEILSALSADGEVKPQLLRYSVNENGEITHIDLATTDFDFAERPEDDRDSLRRFSFTSNGAAVTSFNYRSGGKSCAPYFNLNNTIVFSVPKDDTVKTADLDKFLISDAGGLTSNRNYSFEVYDLNEYGTAGAVVLKGEQVAQAKNYMIESVARGILPDGSEGTIIYTYGSSRYETFYIPAEVEATLTKELCAGDIIELISDDGNIVKELTVVFDASSGLPVPNTAAGGSIRFEVPSAISYFYGALYAVDSTYAYLSKTEDGNGGYLYDLPHLINLKLQTSNMAIINANRNEIRPITIKELKDYKTFGNGNYYVVVYLNYQAPNAVYVYER